MSFSDRFEYRKRKRSKTNRNLDDRIHYALGGFIGGQNKNRIGYLYSEFTKLVIEQFGLN